jgi:hypothetical protein
MEETYKGHVIRSGARPVPGTTEWKPYVEISWQQARAYLFKTFKESHFNLSYPTEKDAEMEGHFTAQKWIDDGKT